MKDHLIIFDTTWRDGEQSPGASMTREEKVRIARQLERMRVDVIEAGFPAASNGDFEAVRAVANTVKDSVVCLARGTGVTGLAYETIEVNRRLPLLEPMSEIAGRMSILVGGYFLAKHNRGSGVLLGGVPGVLPGKVVVLGGGTSGINAARMAQGLGADVTILEVDLERMRCLDITLHTAHTLYSNEAHLMELLPAVDLLIGAVLGFPAPKPRN